MNWRILVVATLPAFLFGCSRHQPELDTKAPPANTAHDPAPPDRSLTIEEYARLGMPSPDRPWTSKEMDQAGTLITLIGQHEPWKLPRMKSEKSGTLFSRIISLDNWNAFKDPVTPLAARADEASNLLKSQNNINRVYALSFYGAQNAVGDEEVIELMGAMMTGLKTFITLKDEYLSTIKNDPEHEPRKQGLAQIRLGVGQVIQGNLITLTEKHLFRTAQLRRLLGYQREAFPVLFGNLEPETRDRHLRELQRLADSEAMTYLQPDLGQLRDSLKEKLAP